MFAFFFVLISIGFFVTLFSLVLLFLIASLLPDIIPNKLNLILNKFPSCQKMFTRLTFVFCVIIILATVFLSWFLGLLDTGSDHNNQFLPDQAKIDSDPVIIDDTPKNLLWFIHLSDTHLSHLKEKNRGTDLVDFCKNVVPIVNPTLLLLTGDVTDARTKFPLGSEQYLEEWQMYDKVRRQCLQLNPRLKWLDIKGNHDSFNTLENYNNFNNYIVQSNMSKEGKSYRYEIKISDGNIYSFIGADACLKPGVRRPFNFVGLFSQEELNKLTEFKEKSAKTNYTVWYGHYPTSSIFNNKEFRKIMNGPYLCGHYHTVHGLVPSMISTQPQGFLEAETGDWKDYRVFRIAAIDHGLFTFSNYFYQSHHKLPLIVITNPRTVLHQMENLEPFWRVRSSTHIRALIFSHKPIVEAKAFISKEPKFSRDNYLESFELKKSNSNDSRSQVLWTSEWSPQKYAQGLYYITVIASDDNYSNHITVPFSLDRTKPSFSLLARMIIRIDFRSLTMSFFCWAFFFSTLPLIVLRLLTSNKDYHCHYMFNLSRRRYIRKIIFRLYLLAHQNNLYYPLVFLQAYTLIGPWFIAHLVSDYIGIVFAWGQFVQGYFLPVGFTWFFAALYTFIFHIPFVICLSILLNIRYIEITKSKQTTNDGCDDDGDNDNSNNNINGKKMSEKIFNGTNFYLMIMSAIIIGQFAAASLFYFAYGFLAFITNFYLWICIVYIILIRVVLNLNHFNLWATSYQSCARIASDNN